MFSTQKENDLAYTRTVDYVTFLRCFLYMLFLSLQQTLDRNNLQFSRDQIMNKCTSFFHWPH